MSILNYKDAKGKPAALIAMTSLNRNEFEKLCIYFCDAWNAKIESEGRDPSGCGRKPRLTTMEDKLFFILFYLKTYPLQEVIAHLFDMSQSQANFWIHTLSKVLKDALHRQGYTPPRIPKDMLDRLENEELQDFAIDGTERKINRPIDNDVQKEFYSGKKKTHTIKNNLVVGIEDRQIKYLGDTHEGKKHDKKICDEEEIKCPKNSICYRDNGFQGYEMEEIDIREPKKKPRNGELTEEEKNNNKLISSLRVIVEHVISGAKRCRIVKDVFRNTKLGYDDLAMEIACGLHNYRSHFRLASY